MASRNEIHDWKRELADRTKPWQPHVVELTSLEIDDPQSRVSVDEFRQIEHVAYWRRSTNDRRGLRHQFRPLLWIARVHRFERDRDQPSARSTDIGYCHIGIADRMAGNRAISAGNEWSPVEAIFSDTCH